MHMTKTRFTRELGVQTTREGYREPYLQIQLPREAGSRVLSAELHRLAAEVELATPYDELWTVHILPLTHYPPTGRVYIELSMSFGPGAVAEMNRASTCLAQAANLA